MTPTHTSSARHAALAEQLMRDIAEHYPVGSRFPTEVELQERIGVGRYTIREALKILAEQGVLGRRRKTGTVVLAHAPFTPYVHSLRDVRGLFDFAQSTRLDISHEGYVTATERTLAHFTDLTDTRWFRLAGLRSTRTGNEPLCWSEVLVPERFTPEREAARQGDRAIYQVVLSQYDLRLDYVEQEISAGDLAPAFAKLMRVDTSAALIVRRRYVASTGATFEISQNVYPGNRYAVRSIIRQRS